jgi:multidrug resistance efflux pump
MFRKFGLPLLSVALLILATLHVFRAGATPPQVPPPVEPGRTPYSRTVAGTGLVEAQTENIAIGTPLSGVVTEVFVQPGRKVKAGAPLFRLDDRALRAELLVRRASLTAAEKQLVKLETPTRPEEVDIAQAKMRAAAANFDLLRDQADRARKLGRTRSVSPEELTQRVQSAEVARHQLDQARTEHRLVKAGAWGPDREIARAAVTQARAQLQQTRSELDRLVVRAPLAGEVLQVNVRPGEFVGNQAGPGLIVLGNLGRLHVRVQIDEHDIPRFRPRATALAALRGHPHPDFELAFVRVEPFVVPKKSLTSEGGERVDTRVLQVIYALEKGSAPLYVGQQVDVFILAQ